MAPEEIAPGESVQLIANARRSDGSNENVTGQAEWAVRSTPAGSEVLAVTGPGMATGVDRGRGIVTVRLGDLSASATILVLPQGTFHVAGRVSDGALPLEGVRVTVIRGTGEGLTTRTDDAGLYELYGVAGSVRIRASLTGYLEQIQRVEINSHASLVFELSPTPEGPAPGPGPSPGPPPETPAPTPAPPSPSPPSPPMPPLPDPPVENLAGLYTLTITGKNCTPVFPEAGKRRVYDARIDQTGSDLRVVLSGGVLAGSDAFAGTIGTVGGIEFYIRPLSPWDYDAFDLQELLPDGSLLRISGVISARGTSAGIVGTGAAELYHQDTLGRCDVDRFEMLPR